MKKVEFCSKIWILLLILILGSNLSYSQIFERIERLAGLGNLSNNNSISCADYDQDYDLDFFIVSRTKDKDGFEHLQSKLMRNDGNGRFSDVTNSAGLENTYPDSIEGRTELQVAGLDGYKYGSFWGDYDNDGFSDLFLTNYKTVALYKNMGNGTFNDVTESTGIIKKNGCHNMGATWFDYNNDGFLDLFINDWNGCKQNTFYENNGDGTFSNISNKTKNIASDKYASYVMFPFDFNGDGWQDLYISNDLKNPNSLYINNIGESFTDEAENYGLNNKISDMDISINDFNNDGNFDFLITGIDENVLFQNNGNNLFSDVAINNNIMNPEAPWADYWYWGSSFGDFDLDGDEDLVLANGSPISIPQFNYYYRNDQKELQKFTNINDELGFGDPTVSISVLSFDYDNDGDLDIVITNTKSPYFFENKINSSLTKSDYNWFKVYLEGTVSNKSAYGTEVSIKTENQTLIRYYNGVSFISQNLKPLHFGLNTDEEIIEIKIKWPSGIVETYNNLDINTHVKFIESNSYQILPIVPSQKILGCTDQNSCSYNPEATENDGSCTYLDTPKITGNVSSSVLKEESYSFEPQMTGSKMEWSITGGEILDGESSNTVNVKWGLYDRGEISVIEYNDNCSSNISILNIDLNVEADIKNVSIARIWNEALLNAIRNDFARPTVHARNLFHFSIAAYDIWAIFNKNAKTYLIGNTTNDFSNSFEGFNTSEKEEESLQKAISYACYRLLNERFKNSPGSEESLNKFDFIMNELGYDTDYISTDYKDGKPESLGNYVASIILEYGSSDGSNNKNDYANLFYQPTNSPLVLGDQNEEIQLIDSNRWQPLTFTTFIDQSGNVAKSTPDFLSPEWGNVKPFSLKKEDKLTLTRDGDNYEIYHLPEHPPKLDTINETLTSELYKWNFALVSKWSSHLDPSDGVMIDISPASIGNIDISLMPNNYQDYTSFYKDENGGDISIGHQLNPITQKPYEKQIVPRADYARVLAEFWADGPDSETPPGHWFTILNYVSDHPLLEKRLNGKGDILSDLEWDVKTYFTLGGAMHDSAISAWSIKGWVDYIRPISAIRYMAKLGQSSDKNLGNYHPGGIPLIEGFIETIENDDILSGENGENIGEIKLKAWRGHDYVKNTETDIAGVGWILAKNWWPYQRPTFVTPPFAGFVSGHSTFSRSAAEVLTLLTGDEYFPGGIGEFKAKKDQFLVFEKGPSVDVTLQWATYRDASDQTSLSRIWGGIHPPADDIPGRLIGHEIGIQSYSFAKSYFNAIAETERILKFYPNPTKNYTITIKNTLSTDQISIYDSLGRQITREIVEFNNANKNTTIFLPESLSKGIYFLRVNQISKAFIISK